MTGRPRKLKSNPRNGRAVRGAPLNAQREVVEAPIREGKSFRLSIIDAHASHLERDADLVAIIVWLETQTEAAKLAPPRPGRSPDYEALLDVARSIAAAGVPLSTARGSRSEQAVIRDRLKKRAFVGPNDADELKEWAHNMIRKLLGIRASIGEFRSLS